MKIRDMTRCAMFAALLGICAWISVPMGDLAISLQTIAVFLALGVLGGRKGSLTFLVYLTLGAVGLPVFTGMQGGLGILLGPTGGYLWGFLASGLIFWILEKRLPLWLSMTLGLLACYTCGTAWYYLAYANTGLWAVIVKCVAPYLLPDGIKLAVAMLVIPRLKKT